MKLLGQELSVLKNQFNAVVSNIYAWLVSGYLSKHDRVEKVPNFINSCISIMGPGGFDSLVSVELFDTSENINEDAITATVGYNVKSIAPPFVLTKSRRQRTS